MNPNDPTSAGSPGDPENTDEPWEEAMSRDFDARVRDLHEAPLDLDSVKGTARRIRRNRRAAVAGGILGVAAVITPIAVIVGNGADTGSREPQFAPQVTRSTATDTADDPTPESVGADYLADGTWHQADGGKVDLPDTDQPYESAVLWDGNLVTTRWDGEVFNVTTVIAEDGTHLDTIATAGSPVVTDDGSTIAFLQPDGEIVVDSGDGELVIGRVDMAAPGETVAWVPDAVSGAPDCVHDAEGCTVFLSSSLGEQPAAYSSTGTVDQPVPGARSYGDATATNGAAVTYLDTLNEDNTVCGGLYDLESRAVRWHTCDYDPQAISPDGKYVVGAPDYGSGLGHPQIDVLDAADGSSTAQHAAPDGGYIWTGVAWSESGDLLLSEYDGERWHLVAMTPDGETTDLAAVRGGEVDNPFVLVQH